MNVEILYSELYLYGDLFNAKYLTRMLPEATFTWTSFQDEPAFATSPQDLIYIGSLPDHLHEAVLFRLSPYRAQLQEHLSGGRILFATGNAADLFGTSLHQGKKEIPGLSLAPYYSSGHDDLRYNSWLMGSFQDSIPIIGNKSEFSVLYTEDTSHAFFRLYHGKGLNHEGALEGYHQGSFYATKLLGPFFIMNPLFSEYFLQTVLKEDHPLPLRDELLTAFHARREKLLQNIVNNFEETNIRRLEA